MWRTLVFGGLSLVWLFSCSSSSKNNDTVCNPKMTQACNKAGCVGVQECQANGNDWGPCECSGTGGTSTGGSSSGGSGGTSASGGTSSGGTSSGGSGGASGGASGTAGAAGSASGGAAGSGGACGVLWECTDLAPCCEAVYPAGKQQLKNYFEANCADLSAKGPECTAACNGGVASDDLTKLLACTVTLTGGYKADLLFDCGCAEFANCLGSCI